VLLPCRGGPQHGAGRRGPTRRRPRGRGLLADRLGRLGFPGRQRRGVPRPSTAVDVVRRRAGHLVAGPHTDLTGAANATSCAIPHLRAGRRDGRRVEQGSVPRRAELPAYASKARMNALGQSMALVLTPHEILVGTMAPGFVETERAREVLDGELDRLRTRALAGRLAPATRTTPSSPAARLPCRAARCRGAGRRGPVAGWSSAGTADSPHPAGRRPGGSCRPPSAGRP